MTHPIGTIFHIVVGMPGPDLNTAIVIGHSEEGYVIKEYSIWTQKINERIWPHDILYPGEINKNQIPQWALTELQESGIQALKGGEE